MKASTLLSLVLFSGVVFTAPKSRHFVSQREISNPISAGAFLKADDSTTFKNVAGSE
jgi:hypothetical protein